jgi:hypothetical protein
LSATAMVSFMTNNPNPRFRTLSFASNSSSICIR